jgi:hypothetical protein
VQLARDTRADCSTYNHSVGWYTSEVINAATTATAWSCKSMWQVSMVLGGLDTRSRYARRLTEAIKPWPVGRDVFLRACGVYCVAYFRRRLDRSRLAAGSVRVACQQQNTHANISLDLLTPCSKRAPLVAVLRVHHHHQPTLGSKRLAVAAYGQVRPAGDRPCWMRQSQWHQHSVCCWCSAAT